MNNGSIRIEIGRLLGLVKGRVLIPAQGMLRSHVPKVHVGTKWLLEVHHVGGTAALRADILLASEVNTKETGR